MSPPLPAVLPEQRRQHEAWLKVRARLEGRLAARAPETAPAAEPTPAAPPLLATVPATGFDAPILWGARQGYLVPEIARGLEIEEGVVEAALRAAGWGAIEGEQIPEGVR